MFTIEKNVAQSAAKADTIRVWGALADLEDIQYRLYSAVELIYAVHSQITGGESRDAYRVSERTLDGLYSLYRYLSDLSEKELKEGIAAAFDAVRELKTEAV